MNYLLLLLSTGGTAVLVLFLIYRNILIKNIGIIFRTIFGSLFFGIPWEIIAINKRAWYFTKPVHTLSFIEVPLEEIIFISLTAIIFTSVTLIFLKKTET